MALTPEPTVAPGPNTQAPAELPPTPVAGHWGGLVSDLESVFRSVQDHVSTLVDAAAAETDQAVGYARDEAARLVGFAQERLQQARNWLDAHQGSPVVSPPAQDQEPAPLTPAQQAQETPTHLAGQQDPPTGQSEPKGPSRRR